MSLKKLRNKMKLNKMKDQVVEDSSEDSLLFLLCHLCLHSHSQVSSENYLVDRAVNSTQHAQTASHCHASLKISSTLVLEIFKLVLLCIVVTHFVVLV